MKLLGSFALASLATAEVFFKEDFSAGEFIFGKIDFLIKIKKKTAGSHVGCNQNTRTTMVNSCSNPENGMT